jgi:pimeloyl-ACP methyl ester carboxylesterase
MVQELAVPVYFFSGKYDLTVNVDLSREYLRMLRAPIKGFYTFAESAHSPIFEEPGRLKQIMATDVKCFKADMADELEGVE